MMMRILPVDGSLLASSAQQLTQETKEGVTHFHAPPLVLTYRGRQVDEQDKWQILHELDYSTLMFGIVSSPRRSMLQ